MDGRRLKKNSADGSGAEVNFLALAGRDGEAVGLVQRFSCASAAVTLASIATHPLMANFQLGSLRALRRQACQAVRSANPVAALEMCSIDVVRHLGAENGFSHGPGLLFASGCMAGCFAQSVVHVHDAVNQKRERRRELLANLRSVVPAMLKHAPAVGVNSVVRVGLVTHFLSQ
ncbi:unnamed protein product [Effrenium voratum]|uniref:Uncharacterized protein n=1 Tax=Effrenium voratum TaxID=2562239 RepID=A0AA36MSU2_9DINO|nr:unnamed protein product [Effrenium voratum]